MRPPELDVVIRLHQLHCKTTEDDGGDEPYMWILGFKADADTLGPPPDGSLLPSIEVQVFENIPASPWVIGNNEINAGNTVPIPANLGTRSCRLRPARLPIGGWFPGLAGVICFLWDQDSFSPKTSEAGYKVFKKRFGPALGTELTRLINGAYDAPLSRDAAGNVVPIPPSGMDLTWRLGRMRDAAGRGNAVKAIRDTIRGQLKGPIEEAISDEADWDEVFDPDDLLGVQAEVFIGDDLSTPRDFTLRFTEDGADYTAFGQATGKRVHVGKLDAALVRTDQHLDQVTTLMQRVCWFPVKGYNAYAYRIRSVTQCDLRTIAGPAPAAVRWFLDGVEIPAGDSTRVVQFEAAFKYSSPPADVLAGLYPGGPGQLKCRASGTVLEVSHEGGNGFFFGEVRALYALPGDPPITAPGNMPFADQLRLGYDLAAQLSVVGAELRMSSDYYDDVSRCKKIVADIDRKHIAVNFGKAFIKPGDPPPDLVTLLEQVTADSRLVSAANVELAARPDLARGTIMARPVIAVDEQDNA